MMWARVQLKPPTFRQPRAPSKNCPRLFGRCKRRPKHPVCWQGLHQALKKFFGAGVDKLQAGLAGRCWRLEALGVSVFASNADIYQRCGWCFCVTSAAQKLHPKAFFLVSWHKQQQLS